MAGEEKGAIRVGRWVLALASWRFCGFQKSALLAIHPLVPLVLLRNWPWMGKSLSATVQPASSPSRATLLVLQCALHKWAFLLASHLVARNTVHVGVGGLRQGGRFLRWCGRKLFRRRGRPPLGGRMAAFRPGVGVPVGPHGHKWRPRILGSAEVDSPSHAAGSSGSNTPDGGAGRSAQGQGLLCDLMGLKLAFANGVWSAKAVLTERGRVLGQEAKPLWLYSSSPSLDVWGNHRGGVGRQSLPAPAPGGVPPALAPQQPGQVPVGFMGVPLQQQQQQRQHPPQGQLGQRAAMGPWRAHARGGGDNQVPQPPLNNTQGNGGGADLVNLRPYLRQQPPHPGVQANGGGDVAADSYSEFLAVLEACGGDPYLSGADNPLHPLPPDLTLRVLSLLGPRDLANTCVVSKGFLRYAEAPALWLRFMLAPSAPRCLTVQNQRARVCLRHVATPPMMMSSPSSSSSSSSSSSPSSSSSSAASSASAAAAASSSSTSSFHASSSSTSPSVGSGRHSGGRAGASSGGGSGSAPDGYGSSSDDSGTDGPGLGRRASASGGASEATGAGIDRGDRGGSGGNAGAGNNSGTATDTATGTSAGTSTGAGTGTNTAAGTSWGQRGGKGKAVETTGGGADHFLEITCSYIWVPLDGAASPRSIPRRTYLLALRQDKDDVRAARLRRIKDFVASVAKPVWRMLAQLGNAAKDYVLLTEVMAMQDVYMQLRHCQYRQGDFVSEYVAFLLALLRVVDKTPEEGMQRMLAFLLMGRPRGGMSYQGHFEFHMGTPEDSGGNGGGGGGGGGGGSGGAIAALDAAGALAVPAIATPLSPWLVGALPSRGPCRSGDCGANRGGVAGRARAPRVGGGFLWVPYPPLGMLENLAVNMAAIPMHMLLSFLCRR